MQIASGKIKNDIGFWQQQSVIFILIFQAKQHILDDIDASRTLHTATVVPTAIKKDQFLRSSSTNVLFTAD